MKKLLPLFLLLSIGASAQQWTLVNNTLTIQIKKNTGTPVQVGKWLSNFAIVGDSVSVIYQRNQDNSHFTYYIDKDSVVAPVMASSTALYDTLVKWTIGSSSFDTTSLSNRIDAKVDSVKRKAGTDSVFYYTNGTQHFAFIDSVSSATIAAAAWSLTGNAGTTAATNFIGPTDSVSWSWRTNNRQWGQLQVKGQLWLQAGLSDFFYDSTAINSQFLKTANLAVGDSTMMNIRFGHDTAIAHNNSAFGYYALRDIRGGWGNDAFGAGSLTHLLGEYGTANHNPGTPYGQGYENTALGFGSQHLNHNGWENVSIGAMSLFTNLKPKDNIAIGVGALMSSVDTVQGCVAIGTFALQNFTSQNAGANVAVGNSSQRNVTTAYSNVSVGHFTLGQTTTGFSNTAVGDAAGFSNMTGLGNTYLGLKSGQLNTGSSNTFLGTATGWNSTALSNRLLIGYGANNITPNDDTTKTLMYGVTGADSSNSFLEINGQFRINNGGNAVLGQRLYLSNLNGLLSYTAVTNDTTAGDAATINSVVGRFKKDSSGSTFTLTNSFITLNSALTLTANNAAIDATATSWTYTSGAGVATIIFNAAPTSDFKMIFKVEN